MGGIASTLTRASTVTGEQFNKDPKMKEISEMSDALFTFMYSKYTQKDIFEIAENPGEYVIAISDLITAQFNVLGYTTQKNKFGEIYFKKWEDLDPPKSVQELEKLLRDGNPASASRYEKINKLKKRISIERSEKKQKQHENNAKIIAFYFVRLFQILGALLLVVKDSRFPEVDERGIVREGRNDYESDKSRIYAGQAYSAIKGFNPPRSIQYGGRITREIALGPFDFLRKYLEPYDTEYVTKMAAMVPPIQVPAPKGPGENVQTFRFSGSDCLFFKNTIPKDATIIGQGMPGSVQEFIMLIKSPTGDVISKAIKVEVTTFFTDTSESKLNEYKAPGLFDVSQQAGRYPGTVVLTIMLDSSRRKFNATFRKAEANSDTKDVSVGMNYKLISGGERERDLYEALQGDYDPDPRKVIAKIFEQYVIRSIRNNSSYSDYSIYKPRLVTQDEESLYPEERDKKTEAPKSHPGLLDIYKLNNDNKHLPHCISRALQLLDAASINDMKSGNAGTKICSGEISGTGSTYGPLKSIGQLFGKLDVKNAIVNEKEFDKASGVLKAFVGQPGVPDSAKSNPLTVKELETANQMDEKSEMEAALKRLSKAFHVNQKLTEEMKKLDGFSSIKLESPPICATKGKGAITIIKGGPQYLELQRHSQRLLAYHLNNIIDISKFLQTIFNIKQRPDGTSWEIKGPNTEILFAGYETLNELTRQARTLLINYYSGCEEIYQQGVASWISSQPGPGESEEAAKRLLKGDTSNPGRANMSNPVKVNDPRAPGQEVQAGKVQVENNPGRP